MIATLTQFKPQCYISKFFYTIHTCYRVGQFGPRWTDIPTPFILGVQVVNISVKRKVYRSGFPELKLK